MPAHLPMPIRAPLCAFAFVLGFAPVARADIYKCVDGTTVAYQSMPCAATAQQSLLAKSAPPAVEAPSQAALQKVAAVTSTARRQGPWTHKTLTLGISDDEVLNMPAWGRPARIVRTRMPRGWSEEWFYGERMGGERRLLFVNAKLVDIGSSPASESTMIATAATTPMQ